MIDVHAVGGHRDDAAPAPALEDPSTPRKSRRARYAAPDAAPIKEKLHITCQFRHAQAMVYELRADQRQIEVRIQAAKSGGKGWDVALVVKGDGERAHRAAGPTRVEAMAALEQATPQVLEPQDWADLRGALVEVRALG